MRHWMFTGYGVAIVMATRAQNWPQTVCRKPGDKRDTVNTERATGAVWRRDAARGWLARPEEKINRCILFAAQKPRSADGAGYTVRPKRCKFVFWRLGTGDAKTYPPS